MVAEKKNVDASEVTQLATQDKAVQAIFRALLERRRDRSITDLKQFYYVVHKHSQDIEKDAFLNAFRSFQTKGWGTITEGRGKTPPRFHWSVPIKTLVKPLAGTASFPSRPKLPIMRITPEGRSLVLEQDDGTTVRIEVPASFNARQAKALVPYLEALANVS